MSNAYRDPSESELSSFRSREIPSIALDEHPVTLTATATKTVVAPVPSPGYPVTTAIRAVRPAAHPNNVKNLPEAQPFPVLVSPPNSQVILSRSVESSTCSTHPPPAGENGTPVSHETSFISAPRFSPSASTHTAQGTAEPNTAAADPTKMSPTPPPLPPTPTARQQWLQRVKVGGHDHTPAPLRTGVSRSFPQQEPSGAPSTANGGDSGTQALTAESSEAVSLTPVPSSSFMRTETLPPSPASPSNAGASPSRPSPQRTAKAPVRGRGSTLSIVVACPSPPVENAATKATHAQTPEPLSPHPRHNSRVSAEEIRVTKRGGDDDGEGKPTGSLALPFFQHVSPGDSAVPSSKEVSSGAVIGATATAAPPEAMGSRVLHLQRSQFNERDTITTPASSFFPSQNSCVFEDPNHTRDGSTCLSLHDVPERAPFHSESSRSPANYATPSCGTPTPAADLHAFAAYFASINTSMTMSVNGFPQLGHPETSGSAQWHDPGGIVQLEPTGPASAEMSVADARLTPPAYHITDVRTPLVLPTAGLPDCMPLSFFSAGASRAMVPALRLRRHHRQRSSVLEHPLTPAEHDAGASTSTISITPRPGADGHMVLPQLQRQSQSVSVWFPAQQDASPRPVTQAQVPRDESVLLSAGASVLLPGARSTTFLTPFRSGVSDGERTPLTARLQPAGPSVFYLRYEQESEHVGTNGENGGTHRDRYSAPEGRDGAVGKGKQITMDSSRGRYAYRSDSQLLNPQETYLEAEDDNIGARRAATKTATGTDAGVPTSTTRVLHRRSLNARGRKLRERIQKLRDRYTRSLHRHAKEVANGACVCVSEVPYRKKLTAGSPVTHGDVTQTHTNMSLSLSGRSPRGTGPQRSYVCFDQRNITIQRYDTVRFRWRDPLERIIETTSDFFQEFPGGMHSPAVAMDNELYQVAMLSSAADQLAQAAHSAPAAAIPLPTAKRPDQSIPDSESGEGSGSRVDEQAADAAEPTEAIQETGQPDSARPSTSSGGAMPRDDVTVTEPPLAMHESAGTNDTDSGRSQQDMKAQDGIPCAVDDADYKMHYNLVFTDPGDYYFICTRDHRLMRVHVQVRDTEPIWWLPYLLYGILAVMVLLAIALVSFGVSQGFTKLGILTQFITLEDNNTLQAHSLKQVDALLTRRLLPWVTVGVLLLLVSIVTWSIWSRCCNRRPARPEKHMPSTMRGYTLRTRKGWSIVTAIATFLCFALSVGVWGALLTTVYDTSTTVNTLVDSIFDTVYTFRGAIVNGESVVGALPDLVSPTVEIPYADINRTLRDIDDTLSDINGWVSFIANLVQACIRALPFLSFVILQISIVACLYGFLGAVLRLTHSTQLAVWLCLIATGCVAIGAGFYWCVYGAIDIIVLLVSSFTYQNDTTGAEWAARVMFSSQSPLAELYDACIPGGLLSTENVVEVLNDTVNSIYDSLDETERNDYKELFDIAGALTNASGTLYENYFYWVAAQAEQMQIYMNDVGDDSGLKKAAPLISSGIGIAMTLATALNCACFRDLFVDILPMMQVGMIDTLHALYALYITLFALLFVTVILATITTFVLFHPRKNWFHFRTRRWFRLHWSYRTHQRLIERGGMPVLDAYQEEEYRRASVTRQLDKCRHAAMFLSLLLAVDGIVLAILSRFNERGGLLIAGPFLLYAQCVLFSFGHVLVHYRFLLMQLCTLGSFLCLLTYVVTQLVEGIRKLVMFTDCVTHKRSDSPEVTVLYPVYLSCPPLTMAGYLEEGVYPILTALVALAVAALQLVLLLHPLQLRRISQDVRSLRVSRDVLRISPKSRLLRWLMWSVVSVLALALLLGLVLSKQHIITVTANVNRTDDADLNIVNVVDPTIGCNGNRAYCSQTFRDLIWIAAHNAYSSQDLNFVTPNHYWRMELQLKAGVRVFLIDPWYDRVDPNNASSPQEVYLCHSVCTIGRELMQTALEPLATFLATYPEEVVMLDLEQYVTNADIGRVLGALDLLKYTWTPNTTPIDDEAFVWPTLGELVASNQRLMVFGTSENYTKPDFPKWMLPRNYFRYESPWTTYQPNQFNCNIDVYWCSSMPDPKYTNYSTYNQSDFTNCTSSLGVYKNESYTAFMREHHALPPVMHRKLALINAMVTIGVAIPSDAAQVNQPPILSALAGRCAQTWGRIPNILAVDYWNVGNTLQQAMTMNDLIARYGASNWQNHLSVPLYTEYQPE